MNVIKHSKLRPISSLLGGDGGGRGVVDQALVLALLDADVALLTPRRSPRVLDDPVRRLVLIVEANGEHAVVDLARDAVGHDAAGVRLPRGGVDADGNRAVGEHLVRNRVLIVGNVLVSGDLGAVRVARGLARWCNTVAGDVGVAVLGRNLTAAGLHQPLESVVHEAAVAAIAGGVARHQVLLRQRHELVVLDEPLALDVAGGREGPARAALALVLDGRHGALGAPVDLLPCGRLERLAHGDVALVEGSVVLVRVVVTLELGGGEVRELVDAERRQRVQVAHLARLDEVRLEDLEASCLLLLGVLAVELCFERLKLRIVAQRVQLCPRAHGC
jgi:hypothetical protein